MYILAGLGNPGIKYKHTRHNAGFDAIDVLADRYNIPVRKSERNALTGQGIIEGEKVLSSVFQFSLSLFPQGIHLA